MNVTKIFLIVEYLFTAVTHPFMSTFFYYDRLENRTISYYTNSAYESDDYYTYDWISEYDDDEESNIVEYD